jgi:methylated-DNA-[protein]-cysteine S-methyltransferase
MTRYTTALHPTPVGDVLLTLADERLALLRVVRDDASAAREEAARLFGAAVEDDPAPAAGIAAQLDEYFAGRRREFDVTLEWGRTAGFTRAALEAIRDIPYGETASYGEVAMMADHPRAARAVGTACAHTPFSIVVPVHRVVRSDGSIGEYGGHPEVKRFLLALEQDAGA